MFAIPATGARAMQFRTVTLAALVLIPAAADPARSTVRFEILAVPGPSGEPMEAGVWYPVGAKGKLPLVVMSHGNGGWYRGHSDTAEALARAGMVAAAVTHPGDNWRDSSRSFAVWRRPRHIRSLLDHMLGAWPARARIDSRRIGAFGFSAGGFTMLVAAGGKPDLARIRAHCRANPRLFDCQVAAKGPTGLLPLTRLIPWTQDRRIRAVVVAAPALGFTFGRTGLRNVRVPVQLWRAEADEVLPSPFYAEPVLSALRARPDYRVVANAGHFDFLEPCRPEFRRQRPRLCASRPGFDRAAFHQLFNQEVVRFFRRHLGPAQPSRPPQ
jgi:predicted dienelactone hydrolase